MEAKVLNYSNNVVENMIKNAESRSYTQDLRVLNVIKMNDQLGYSVVKGLSDTYTVSYMTKGNTTFVYECSCPHNTHRGLPCKHMFKVGRQLNSRGVNAQLVVVNMEKGQKEKVLNTDTVNVVDLSGSFVTPNISMPNLVNSLKTVEGATLEGGVVYTHRVSNAYDEVAIGVDYDDEPVYIDDSVNCSKVMGTNYNLGANTNVDTITLVIKGTTIKISGNNLVVNVE